MRYFEVFGVEANGRLYERLGVRYFKRFASAGDVENARRRRTEPGFRNIATYEDAWAWRKTTVRNEGLHLASLFFSIGMTAWLVARGRYAWLGLIVVLNLVLNVYPIFLQRYNRARIERIRHRRASARVRRH